MNVSDSATPLRIVVLGAGYGGVTAALRLARKLRPRLRTAARPAGEIELTLIDRNAYHTLETRLHEAAAHGTNVTIPLARLLAGRGVGFRQGTITRIDLAEKRITTSTGELTYDRLIIALGTKTAFFRIPGLAEHAFELKSAADAAAIKTHIEAAYARALGEPDPAERRRLRSVALGGGGWTGVELAGELAERVTEWTERDPDGAGQLVVVEAGERILPSLTVKPSREAAAALTQKGIRTLVETKVTGAKAGAVQLRRNDGSPVEGAEADGWLPVETIVWAGGIEASQIVGQAGAAVGRQGRILVDETLTVKGFSGVYGIGDNALAIDPATGNPVPTAAQFALQQGRVAADNLVAELAGRSPEIYRPKLMGEVVSLGQHLALGYVALPGVLGKLKFFGFLGSLLKRAIAEKHLVLLWRERAAWDALKW